MNRRQSRYGGVRRIIVSEDQARNLAEMERQTEELHRLIERTGGGCSFPDIAARMKRDDDLWDGLGEESQDPGDWGPA